MSAAITLAPERPIGATAHQRAYSHALILRGLGFDFYEVLGALEALYDRADEADQVEDLKERIKDLEGAGDDLNDEIKEVEDLASARQQEIYKLSDEAARLADLAAREETRANVLVEAIEVERADHKVTRAMLDDAHRRIQEERARNRELAELLAAREQLATPRKRKAKPTT